MSFHTTGLKAAPFDHYFSMDDEELAQAGSTRRATDSLPGFPCRISITDASVGTEVVLLNHEHLALFLLQVDDLTTERRANKLGGCEGSLVPLAQTMPGEIVRKILGRHAA